MLQKYLDENGLTGVKFAELAGLKQYEISRLLSNDRKASVRIAAAIEKATDGKVTRAHLRPDIFGEVETAA